MREIETTNGMTILVDNEDYDVVKNYNWFAMKKGDRWYAVTNKNGYVRVYMHKLIVDYDEVDHANRNGLDNRKINLRNCTRSQNNQNQRKRLGASSKYKGVSWKSDLQKWRAKIYVRYQEIHLGYFENEIEAARAYDEAAREHFGEFARTNF